MPKFDFRKYHIRSINAANDTEKAAINQELKDLYESLSAEDKLAFNEQLQAFLMSQYKTLGTDYQSVKDSGAVN